MAIQPPGSYVKANKKGGDKKSTKVDTYARKEWFDLKVPAIFPNTTCGKTMVTKLSNKQNLAPALIGRRFIVNHGDLSGSQEMSFRNFVFKVYEVRGKDCVGIFDGMEITSDKRKSIVRKGHTLIEAVRDVEAKDGSIFRVSMVGITRRKPYDTKKTCYCKSSEEKAIRKVMFDVIDEELKGMEVQKIVKKLAAETVGKIVEQKAGEIFPLQNVMVIKVKTIKSREFEDLKFARYAENKDNLIKVE